MFICLLMIVKSKLLGNRSLKIVNGWFAKYSKNVSNENDKVGMNTSREKVYLEVPQRKGPSTALLANAPTPDKEHKDFVMLYPNLGTQVK